MCYFSPHFAEYLFRLVIDRPVEFSFHPARKKQLRCPEVGEAQKEKSRIKPIHPTRRHLSCNPGSARVGIHVPPSGSPAARSRAGHHAGEFVISLVAGRSCLAQTSTRPGGAGASYGRAIPYRSRRRHAVWVVGVRADPLAGLTTPIGECRRRSNTAVRIRHHAGQTARQASLPCAA